MLRAMFLAVLLLSLSTVAARADSWLPATPATYVSADGTWRLLVTPRGITGPLGYFRDKVDERSNAGGIQGDLQRSATGRMEQLQGRRWRVVWEKPLVNEVAPVDAIVSNTGQAATFDNWHSMGFGDDTIALYDGNGELIRAMGLDGFLPEEYEQALPRTVSSIHWRGSPRISDDGLELIVPVVVPEEADGASSEDEKVAHVDVRFQLSNGRLTRDSGPSWIQALSKARAAYARVNEEAAAAKRRFIAPLEAPVTENVTDWHLYLREVFFRLDPDWEEGYPATHVLPARGSTDFNRMSGYIGEALIDELNADGVMMFASLSQVALRDVVLAQARRVAPRALSRARIYIAVDSMHFQPIRNALAHTGANVVQLDVELSIPQRSERLEAMKEAH